MKLPSNIITTGKYTIGEEYIILSSQTPYQGYYYELNNKTFAGKKFNTNAPEIIKTTSNKFNPLLDNPSTATYAKMSKFQPSTFTPTTLIYNENPLTTGSVDRYFIKKSNLIPFLIKEITKESYDKALSEPGYTTVTIKWNAGGYSANIYKVSAANRIMPGIQTYLESEDSPGDAFEN
jgi:hypothetical protein